MENRSQKFLKKRRFLAVLPVLVLPFLTMAFWAAGGGKGKEKKVTVSRQGLNPKLPDARLKDDKGLNKMNFYDLAQKDSLKLRQAMESDRYSMKAPGDSDRYGLDQLKALGSKYGLQKTPGGVSGSKQAEDKLVNKLNQLEEQMNDRSAEHERYPVNNARTYNYRQQPQSNPDIDRLEKMMHVMKSQQKDNPEMKQLDTMLEKILDLQHPDRVNERLKEKSKQNKKEVLVVRPVGKGDAVSTLGTKNSDKGGGAFYSLGDKTNEAQGAQNAIEAVVHETQTLVSGSVVKLRLLNDISVNGSIVPRDNFISGIAKLSGERLTIEINSLIYNNSIFPVNLEVYDLDGLSGIYIPNAIARTVAKETANSSVQSMGYTTLDPSLAAQATTAGINAAKDLFSKKVKLVRVTVKAGYKVLLKTSSN